MGARAARAPPDPTRRLFYLESVRFVIVLAVAAVLVAATLVRSALGIIGSDRADLFTVLSVVLVLAHLYLVVLARKARVREVQHWTWLLLPLHLVWGSGILVGIKEAVPIGIGIGMLDFLSLVWAQEAERAIE